MMGVAAGLALEGKKVYVYSIIPFATFRCLEQVRNDICNLNLDVTIVAAGAGFAYGTHGPTHFAIEDIAVFRSLPNIAILSPSDPVEMEQLVAQSYKTTNPTYIRLDKNSKILNPTNQKITLGKPSVIKDGKDGVIITTGSYLEVVLNAIQKLQQKGYNLRLISLHTLKPVDEKALLKEIGNQKTIFTAEEHKLIGGLSSTVGEILLKHGKNISLKSIGVKNTYSPIIGSQSYLRKYYSIDENAIYKEVTKTLRKK
jgi:transketolase